MRHLSAVVGLAAFGALAPACARSPRPAAPAPQAAPGPAPAPAPVPTPASAPAPGPEAVPDLSGTWDFEVSISGNQVSGTLRLTRSGDTYGGSALDSEGQEYPLQSLSLNGQKLVMVFATPDGQARVEGALAGAGSMSGTLLLGADTGSFAARRR
jgi:hypothetical protein